MTNNSNAYSINDINRLSSIEVCAQAQEILQELINRFPEINSLIKSSIQGITNSDPNIARFKKLDEHLSNISTLFSSLRAYCKIINQHKNDIYNNSASNDLQSIDQLNQNKVYLIEKIAEKNCFIKTTIDSLLNIIWQINSFESLE